MIPHLVPLHEYLANTDENTLQHQALEACLQIGMMAATENDAHFPTNSKRISIRIALRDYYDDPDRMRKSWMQRFLLISKNAIKYLCATNEKYTEPYWRNILYTVLNGDSYYCEEIRTFCTAVIAVTCVPKQTSVAL